MIQFSKKMTYKPTKGMARATHFQNDAITSFSATKLLGSVGKPLMLPSTAFPGTLNGANSPTQTQHPNAMPASERLSLSTTCSSPAIFTANGSVNFGKCGIEIFRRTR